MPMFVAGLIHALPPEARRCLDREEAASYVGVSVGTFDKLVSAGELPRALQLHGRKVWDKRSLDRSLDLKSGFEDGHSAHQAMEPSATESALDMWRHGRAKH